MKILNSLKEGFKAVSRFVVSHVLYTYLKIVYKAKVTGAEKVPLDGPVILCGNHQTYLDPILIVVASPRKVRFIAKEELRKNLIFRFLLFAYDGICVKRDSKDIGALKEAMKALKNGECIGIFPEGTRNGMQKNEGGKLKNGAAYMSLKTGAKLVPIGINGGTKENHNMKMKYGEPMDFSELLKEKSAKELEDYVSEELKNEIVKLSK